MVNAAMMNDPAMQRMYQVSLAYETRRRRMIPQADDFV